jgi:MFS superfamily sulfate permease-like transporter
MDTVQKKSSLLNIAKELPPDEAGHLTHKHGWTAIITKSFTKETFLHTLKGIFPIGSFLQNYSQSAFLGDLKSSITVSFLLIPAGVAYSHLANVPTSSGLLTCIFTTFVYGILGSSPQLAMGTEAMSSVMVGLSVAEEMKFDPTSNPASVASAIGLLAGIFTIILGVLQAGYIDNILSGYLLTGFVLGVSNVIMIEQIPGLLGLPPTITGFETESAIMKFISICKHIQQTHFIFYDSRIFKCFVLILLQIHEITL